MTPENPNKEVNVVDKKKSDLTNLNRLTQNTINLLNEASFPGTHAFVVIESLNWLNAIKADIEGQLKVFEEVSDIKIPEVVS